MTYPPIFKCSESNDVKTFAYTITIWKLWGGLTFQILVDFPCVSQNLKVWIMQFIKCVGIQKTQEYVVVSSFAKNIKLCVSFAKNMEICEVLPKIWNYKGLGFRVFRVF